MTIKLDRWKVTITATCDGEKDTDNFLCHLANIYADAAEHYSTNGLRYLAQSARNEFSAIFDKLYKKGFYNVETTETH